MSTPNFQKFFKPLLEIASDDKEHSTKEAKEILISKMGLTAEDLHEKVRSGAMTKVDNRIWWAKSYFVKAKVFHSPKRGIFKITERGKDLLAKNYQEITVKELQQYSEFLDFVTPKKNQNNEISDVPFTEKETPEEMLENGYQEIRNELADELLNTIKSNSYDFFENLVIDLMVRMGYGGSRDDAGESIGKVGDEGIDGIIKEDRLGLDLIYLQAKKWEGTIGRPEIQKFVGALHGKRAKKGVFITTGDFTKTAFDYVENIESKIILIDGKSLVNYMIDYNLGVSVSVTYEIKKIDKDYFFND
ncbi:restriction endonuclease [Cyanobacterium sp. IPPAS B-1200]|uniref:restriction endonuclease n=1 Tax=Cyanobacterium sp. IPPAS B-1200 TaxID=1562720 RepID=UPI000852633A|nr:restriction endonuclease [Cyanobacterium sp. IPPAS B-1200]OEJ78560.1 restriction endonuclease [Cyanobacterium sp. IPPAS B-1200]